jgi:hypothetical protein
MGAPRKAAGPVGLRSWVQIPLGPLSRDKCTTKLFLAFPDGLTFQLIMTDII